MGCITSTKKVGEFRGADGVVGGVGSSSTFTEQNADNVFRVRALRLQPDDTHISRHGFLELNPRELIFLPQSTSVTDSLGNAGTPIIWALQHLRRYGVNDEIFCFEAGRRCMTGPGIYTFRCVQAQHLYQLFQRYINEVSAGNDDVFQFPERATSNIQAHANNYLEPMSAGITQRLRESISSSPLSLELDSPNSMPSLSFVANEILHFPSSRYSQTSVPQQPTNLGNIYIEPPSSRERNNNKSMASIYNSDSLSAFSTMSRKLLVPRCSLDLPPEDCAPILATDTPQHVYANVLGLGEKIMMAERCYENLNLQLQNVAIVGQTSVAIADAESMSLNSVGVASNNGVAGNSGNQTQAVNYIVLDLDQPRSPATACAQYSPQTPFGSGLSICALNTDTAQENPSPIQQTTNIFTNSSNAAERLSLTEPSASNSTTTTLTITTTAMTTATTTTTTTLDYSTIDFVKTCALIKSSTQDIDCDPDPDPDLAEEESRITRHSKFVRKAYSISE